MPFFTQQELNINSQVIIIDYISEKCEIKPYSDIYRNLEAFSRYSIPRNRELFLDEESPYSFERRYQKKVGLKDCKNEDVRRGIKDKTYKTIWCRKPQGYGRYSSSGR